MKQIIILLFFICSNAALPQKVDNYLHNKNFILKEKGIKDFCMSPDGQLIAVNKNSKILIVDINSSKVIDGISTNKNNENISKILFTNDSKNLVVSYFTGTACVYPINSKTTYTFGQERIKAVSFDISKDGNLLAILGIVPNRRKANRQVLNNVTNALGQKIKNTLNINTSHPSGKKFNNSLQEQLYDSRFNKRRFKRKSKNKSYNNIDQQIDAFGTASILSDYVYAIQFIELNNPKNSYVIELKDIGFTHNSDDGIYKYMMLGNEKKSIKIQNDFGHYILVTSSSKNGFPNRVNKNYSIQKTDNMPVDLTTIIAYEYYKKLGLNNDIQFNGQILNKINERLVGSRFSKIRNSLIATDLNLKDNYITSSKAIISNNDNYLYFNDNNSQITNFTNNTENPKLYSSKNEKTFENVDYDIPINKFKSKNRYALIIGNENYANFLNPRHALNDARVFKEYCINTLNVPLNNLEYLENGTTSQIKQKFYKISEILKKLNGKGELIFYYAGHMEVDNDGNKYILSTDTYNNKELKYEIKLSDFYNKVYTANNTKNLFFIDACYAGTSRDIINNKNSYGTSRGGIKVKYKNDVLRGNTVSFSSSSDLEKSYSSNKLNHGIFTYNLLLKIKHSKGNITLRELRNFLIREVSITALKLNETNQNPTVDYNPQLNYTWMNWKLSE